jgi:hypothetical protein
MRKFATRCFDPAPLMTYVRKLDHQTHLLPTTDGD